MNTIDISNIPKEQKRRNLKILIGIVLGLILLVAIGIFWLN